MAHTLNQRELRIIKGAMNSTFDHLKGIIRRDETIPNPIELFDFFQGKLSFDLSVDENPKFNCSHTIESDFKGKPIRKGHYQVIYCFNSKMMFISASYSDIEPVGSYFLDFEHSIEFLDEYDVEQPGVDYLFDRILDSCHISPHGFEEVLIGMRGE